MLVVECDLLHPTFESALSLNGGPGLLGILRGSTLPRDAVVRTPNPNLDAIAAGGIAADATALLMRKEVSDLLSWASLYDVVLIDGPLPAVLTKAQPAAGQCAGLPEE